MSLRIVPASELTEKEHAHFKATRRIAPDMHEGLPGVALNDWERVESNAGTGRRGRCPEEVWDAAKASVEASAKMAHRDWDDDDKGDLVASVVEELGYSAFMPPGGPRYTGADAAAIVRAISIDRAHRERITLLTHVTERPNETGAMYPRDILSVMIDARPPDHTGQGRSIGHIRQASVFLPATEREILDAVRKLLIEYEVTQIEAWMTFRGERFFDADRGQAG